MGPFLSCSQAIDPSRSKCIRLRRSQCASALAGHPAQADIRAQSEPVFLADVHPGKGREDPVQVREVELLKVKGLRYAPDEVILVAVENDFDNFNRQARGLGGVRDRPALVNSMARFPAEAAVLLAAVIW